MPSSYSTLDPAAVELFDQITHRNGLGAEGDRISLLEHNQSGLKVQNAERNIAKDCNQTPTQFAWKTPLAIVGCYVSATILAVSHYIFFRLIDGQEASHMFALRQSQVTTVSFLLVTAFRASIVAALGTSFTQYLWYVLRIRCLQVELIESLFKIRSNAWGLFNYKIMRHAPLLFAAAALSWTIPLATIYPPGALTIRFESHTFTTGLNASIMNPPPVSADSSQLPTLAEVFHGVHYHWLGEDIGQRGYVGSTYEQPTRALLSMARFVMYTGQIVPLRPLSSENSSYTMTFEGPQIKCRTEVTNITLDSTALDSGAKLMLFNVTWSTQGFRTNRSVLQLSSIVPKGFFPGPRLLNKTCDADGNCGGYIYPPLDATLSIILERYTLECDAYTTAYTVDFGYERGIQHIKYTTGSVQQLEHIVDNDFTWNATEHTELPNTTQEYLDWTSRLPLWEYKTNSRALIDSVGLNLDYQWYKKYTRDMSDNPIGTFCLPNGNEISIGGVSYTNDGEIQNVTMLEDSVLNAKRFGQNESYTFDPRDSINITEASINELLANISISALSLSTWYGNVTVNDTEYRNVYRFSHPLNFFLPYGLCLAATLVFIVFGLKALRLNGVPATDGGFLQILMATTGDTEMNRIAGEASFKDVDNAPKKLLNMEVRLGDLTGQDGHRFPQRAGFGTAEETTVLNRRGQRSDRQ